VSLAAALGTARGADVWTYHNDNSRTGQNLQETVLTPATVKGGFGKLFTQNVDGYVFAQPLYLTGLDVAGKGRHNVVFIATEHDSVYAFDADSAAGTNAMPLWHVNFLDPARGVTTVPANLPRQGENDTNSFDIVPEIGITGTPVIDRKGGTLYVVAKTKEMTTDGHTHFVQRLHALDVASGAEKLGGPVVIADTIRDPDLTPRFVSGPSVPGAGEGGDGRTVFFDALKQHERAGLALDEGRGVVYIGWASHGDTPPYHGWLTAFDARTLKPAAVFNTTPNAVTAGNRRAGGAIWQAGGAPAIDAAGTLFCMTGNGIFDPASSNFGDSVLKLSTGGGLALSDWFTPFNQDLLENIDLDLGSGGVVLLPDQPAPAPKTRLLVGAGKPGTVYLLDRDNLGKFHAGDDSQVWQALPRAVGGVFSTPAYFNNRVYYLGMSDVLKAFEINGGKLSAAPVSKATQVFGFPGATPSISANGSSDGIVWVVQTDRSFTVRAVLRAYDANDLTNELYNSDMNGTRDQFGGAVKYSVPTVANGKVYVGAQNSFTAFGLLH
jgi:hypothetical protein